MFWAQKESLPRDSKVNSPEQGSGSEQGQVVMTRSPGGIAGHQEEVASLRWRGPAEGLRPQNSYVDTSCKNCKCFQYSVLSAHHGWLDVSALCRQRHAVPCEISLAQRAHSFKTPRFIFTSLQFLVHE